MKSWWRTLFFLVSLAVAIAPHPASAVSMGGMDTSNGRYLGTPDLALTSGMIAAGGGPRTFSAARLSTMLAAQHSADEVQRLDARFGVPRVQQYFRTFDTFVDASMFDMKIRHIRLPRPNPALAHNPYVLAASLRAAGVMPDGRFDVGYFIEHLVSRPVHKDVMKAANALPTIGPKKNADFHVILTSEMDDLKSLYHLPR